MNATLDQLLARTQAAADQRAAASSDRYRSLVRSAAVGESLDADDVAAFLDQHNYEVAAFQKDVQHLAGRLDAKPTAEKKLSAAESKLASLKSTHEAKVTAERAKFEAAVKKLTDEHAAAAAPHETTQAEAERAIEAAREAENHLLDTGSDELKNRITYARGQIAGARDRINQLTSDIARAERKAKDDRPGLIADAEYAGERTFGEEVNKFTGDAGYSHHVAVKERVEANKRRLVAEALARVEQGIQAIRDKIGAEHRFIADWEAEVGRVEQRMLLVE